MSVVETEGGLTGYLECPVLMHALCLLERGNQNGYNGVCCPPHISVLWTGVCDMMTSASVVTGMRLCSLLFLKQVRRGMNECMEYAKTVIEALRSIRIHTHTQLDAPTSTVSKSVSIYPFTRSFTSHETKLEAAPTPSKRTPVTGQQVKNFTNAQENERKLQCGPRWVLGGS